MQLIRIVYLSEAASRFQPKALSELVAHSSERNAALGISGLLLHSAGNFIQVLEGDDLLVTSLYSKIERDPRHTCVRTLLHRSADHRLFPDWGMKLANIDAVSSIDHSAIDKTLLRLRLETGGTAAIESQALDLLQEFRRQLMAVAA